MSNLKLFSTWQGASSEKPFYLSRESSTPEKEVIYPRYSASHVADIGMIQKRDVFGYYPVRASGLQLSFEPRSQTGVDLMGMWGEFVGVPFSGTLFVTGRQGFPTRPRTIPSDEIVIVPLRELSYEDAKREIAEYIQHAGNRKVYVSELAEELRLDIELILQVIEELGARD